MPYIKTIKEMSDIDYVEFVGKIKEALKECDSLTEENGTFYNEVYPSSYNDKISERGMNAYFKEFCEDGIERNFADFLQEKMLENYNYGYNKADEIFNEMSEYLDEETKLSLDVSELLGEVNSDELLTLAGYKGLDINVKDFLEDEYYLNLTTKNFDTRNLSERLEAPAPDDFLTETIQKLGEENCKNIIDGYTDRDNFRYTEDNSVVCVIVDKDDILEMLDNIAKGKEDMIEVKGGAIIFNELDEDVEIKESFSLSSKEINREDSYIKDDYDEIYYGEGSPAIDIERQNEINHEAFKEAFKAVNNGSTEVDLYFDYHDKYDEGQIAEMYHDYCVETANGRLKETSFSDYYTEKTSDWLFEAEVNAISEVAERAMEYLKENNPKVYLNMTEQGNPLSSNLYEYATENADVIVNYDVYDLVPECRLDIMIATKPEINVENSSIDILAETIANGKVAENYEDSVLNNGFIYLLNQQGHTAEEIMNPSDKYMEEVKDVIENKIFNTHATTFLISAEGKELLDLLDLKTAVQDVQQSGERKIEIEAGTKVYLHDETLGDTVDFVPTETPVVIPESMIYEIMVEGSKQRDRDYSVDEVCCLVKSEWDGGAKFTDKEPVPIQDNLENFLETVKENFEKEQEGIDLN